MKKIKMIDLKKLEKMGRLKIIKIMGNLVVIKNLYRKSNKLEIREVI